MKKRANIHDLFYIVQLVKSPFIIQHSTYFFNQIITIFTDFRSKAIVSFRMFAKAVMYLNTRNILNKALQSQ